MLQEVLLALVGQTGRVIEAKEDGFYLARSCNVDTPERNRINATCRLGFMYQRLAIFARQHTNPCTLFSLATLQQPQHAVDQTRGEC